MRLSEIREGGSYIVSHKQVSEHRVLSALLVVRVLSKTEGPPRPLLVEVESTPAYAYYESRRLTVGDRLRMRAGDLRVAVREWEDQAALGRSARAEALRAHQSAQRSISEASLPPELQLQANAFAHTKSRCAEISLRLPVEQLDARLKALLAFLEESQTSGDGSALAELLGGEDASGASVLPPGSEPELLGEGTTSGASCSPPGSE